MLNIEIEQEDDGRWIAEVPALPGALAYGATEVEARSRPAALACRVIAAAASPRMDVHGLAAGPYLSPASPCGCA